VIGNQKQIAVFDNGKSRMPVRFSNFLYDINLNNDGSITYFGNTDSMIPAQRKLPEEEAYDQHYSRTYYVKDGNAFELGYNTGTVKYSESGDLLYSGVADIEKNERLLMMNYGLSKIIINKKKYDDIYDYGFSPAKEIYYAAVTNQNEKTSVENMSYMFLNEKLIGKYVYFSYQNNTSILVFDSENKYAFVAAEGDSIIYKNVIVTNNGRLPFPDSKVAGAEAFSQVSNLMFSKNDKLFYVGDAYSSSQNEEVKRELFVDNRSVGDYYNTISNLRYIESADVITFTGSRGNRIYSVTINF
jgi:hypothetical protein